MLGAAARIVVSRRRGELKRLRPTVLAGATGVAIFLYGTLLGIVLEQAMVPAPLESSYWYLPEFPPEFEPVDDVAPPMVGELRSVTDA